jgi:glycosyltransferase involved in cell wall biosynthesis
MTLQSLRIGLIGPLPPPYGGMANQTQQLGELLEAAGAKVTLVQVNAPYQPSWAGKLPAIRSVFRMAPYLVALWRVAGATDIFHVMANSGWAWHLFAAPAVWIGHWRRVPVVVNYRGGEAKRFLLRSGRLVGFTMRRTSALIVPSAFLKGVFTEFGMAAAIVPNIIDLSRFQSKVHRHSESPHLIVARNLERLYDNETAIRAFRIVHDACPEARLTIAGSGPEEKNLKQFAVAQGLNDSVHFAGRLDRDAMASLYRSADIMLNPSLADNMPNCFLEAWSSGVLIVSTNVGGIPFLAQDGINASLVSPSDPNAMAQATIRLLKDKVGSAKRVQIGLQEAHRYTWSQVRPVLEAVYQQAKFSVPSRKSS